MICPGSNKRSYTEKHRVAGDSVKCKECWQWVVIGAGKRLEEHAGTDEVETISVLKKLGKTAVFKNLIQEDGSVKRELIIENAN